MSRVDPQPILVMTFATLDDAESALDWIGVDFIEADAAFEGVLAADDRARLEAAAADPESPQPVRELARALARLLTGTAPGDRPVWRVAFDA
jgi:hypothetical protein